MQEKKGRSLVGKKEIVSYVRRSWSTIKDWIRNQGFPAKKIDGIWESDTYLVDEWRRKRIVEQ